MDIKSGYFPHDEKASQDQKILQLRYCFGWEGYGLFWAIIETMYCDTTGYINRGALGGLSLGYNTPIEKLQNIFDYCVEIGLLKKCEHENYYNQRVVDWKQYRQKCAEFGKIGGRKSHPLKPPLTPPKETLQASKVKKSKVKKEKKESKNPTLFSEYEFQDPEKWKENCPHTWSDSEKLYWRDRAEAYSNKGNKYINWHKAVQNWKKDNPNQYQPASESTYKAIGF